MVHSLEAALWAFHDAKDFRQAVLRAVNLGDDADTTGAVCGQLAGAYWGESGIPPEWLKGLAQWDIIKQMVQGLSVEGEPARALRHRNHTHARCRQPPATAQPKGHMLQ